MNYNTNKLLTYILLVFNILLSEFVNCDEDKYERELNFFTNYLYFYIGEKDLIDSNQQKWNPSDEKIKLDLNLYFKTAESFVDKKYKSKFPRSVTCLEFIRLFDTEYWAVGVGLCDKQFSGIRGTRFTYGWFGLMSGSIFNTKEYIYKDKDVTPSSWVNNWCVSSKDEHENMLNKWSSFEFEYVFTGSKKYRYQVENSLFADVPDWDYLNEPPPLSITDAVCLSEKELSKNTDLADNFKIRHIELFRWGTNTNKWFYIILYTKISGETTEDISIPILMNGKIPPEADRDVDGSYAVNPHGLPYNSVIYGYHIINKHNNKGLILQSSPSKTSPLK